MVYDKEGFDKWLHARNITESDINVLWQYYRKSINDGLKERTIDNHIKETIYLLEFVKKPLHDITKEDVENYVFNIENRVRDGEIEKSTATQQKIKFKQLLRGIGKADIVDWIKTKNVKSKPKNKDDLLTMAEIELMVNTCTQLRDRVIIALLYDSGCRVGELCNLNISDVEFKDKKGTYIKLDGKTGEREILLFSSVPYLREWLNTNCKNKKPDEPLFLNIGYQHQRLTYKVVQAMIRKIAKDAEITKRVHPHLFRHSRLTQLAQSPEINEFVMREFAGWEMSSTMPSVYIHMAQETTHNALRRMHGEEVDKTEIEEPILQNWVCHNCNENNGSSNLHCYKCGVGKDSPIVNTDDFIDKVMDKLLIKIKQGDVTAMQMLKNIQNAKTPQNYEPIYVDNNGYPLVENPNDDIPSDSKFTLEEVRAKQKELQDMEKLQDES